MKVFFWPNKNQSHVKNYSKHLSQEILATETNNFNFSFFRVNVVQWSEDLYEKQLIERTVDCCGGYVDVVIDFGTTSRSLHRSLQCLNEGGVVLISDETAEKLLPKFSRRAEERKQHIEPVPTGTIDQLHTLTKLVASKDVS